MEHINAERPTTGGGWGYPLNSQAPASELESLAKPFPTPTSLNPVEPAITSSAATVGG